MTKAVAGIGNPGRQYVGTRHNVGFEVLDILADRWGLSWKGNFSGLFADASVGGEKVLLLKPGTFVNLSGRSVGQLTAFYKLPPESLLVVVDDFNLPLGRLRLKKGGSDGGHNGLKSIISTVGREFVRLRVGIGPLEGDPTSFVLSRFSPVEREVLDIALQNAADAVEAWITRGLEEAQAAFNAPDKISSTDRAF